MKNLLYKEFRLVIHPLFYVVNVAGALLLIPEWAYFVATLYFLFTVLPNVFSIAKAQNDISFSAMLPVRRSDIVKARMASVIILEVLQIAVTAAFAVINLAIYPKGNSLLDTNAAFIGFVFIMYAIVNLIFFPMFYKTADKIGLPIIMGVAAAILFAAAVEIAVIFIPELRILDGREHVAAQLLTLAVGMVIFALLNIAAFKMSAKSFKKLNL